MEDGDTEKYYPSSVIQDFVFSSRKSSCIRCISLQVYNKAVEQLTCDSLGKITWGRNNFISKVNISDNVTCSVRK